MVAFKDALCASLSSYAKGIANNWLIVQHFTPHIVLSNTFSHWFWQFLKEDIELLFVVWGPLFQVQVALP